MQTYDDLTRQAARAYKRYFHDRDRSAEALEAMEAIDAEMCARFDVFIQVRSMCHPSAALVIYGSRSAWRNNREPITIIPFSQV